jgi:hypothetical protein
VPGIAVAKRHQDTRTSPIPPSSKIAKHLSALARRHEGFIFSTDGVRPVKRFTIEGALPAMLIIYSHFTFVDYSAVIKTLEAL